MPSGDGTSGNPTRHVGEDDVPLLRWREGRSYRLSHVSGGSERHYPDPVDFWVDSQWLDRRRRRRPLAVLGEPGAGISQFLGWLRAQFGDGVVTLDGRAAGPDLAAWSRALATVKAAAATSPLGAVEAALAHLADDKAPMGLLLLHHLEYLPRVDADAILAWLRATVELGLPTHVRVVLCGQDPQALGSGPYSSAVSAVDLVRPPWFTAEELGVLLDGDTPLSAADLRAVQDATGGHPLLAQLVRKRLIKDTAADAVRWLRTHPPVNLADWQSQLADIIVGSEACRRVAARLSVPNAADETVPLESAPLYLTGWIGQYALAGEDKPRWRMSACHREWARDVLRFPNRFQRSRA